MGFHGMAASTVRNLGFPLSSSWGERWSARQMPVAPPPLSPPPTRRRGTRQEEAGIADVTPPGRAPSAGRSGARPCRCPVRR
jgi:hypothetical protein